MTFKLNLVKDCWSNNPVERPSSEFISGQMRELVKKWKKTNLMDHVFSMLEEYTTTLELEVSGFCGSTGENRPFTTCFAQVDERTKELAEEKKKADLLLGRMLPRYILHFHN